MGLIHELRAEYEEKNGVRIDELKEKLTNEMKTAAALGEDKCKIDFVSLQRFGVSKVRLEGIIREMEPDLSLSWSGEMLLVSWREA